MTIDPKKIREIARVCATLSKSAPTAEEHDIFANLALKWLSIALDRETQVAIDLDRFTTIAVHPVSGCRRRPKSLDVHLGGRGIGKKMSGSFERKRQA